MKYISRLTALLLALMMGISCVSAETNVSDLTQQWLMQAYDLASEPETMTFDAEILGFPMALEVMKGMDKTGYTFVWYDQNIQVVETGDIPSLLETTCALQEQRFTCKISLNGAVQEYVEFVVPAAQTDNLDDYIDWLYSYYVDLYWSTENSIDAYLETAYQWMQSWNVELSDGSNLAENVLAAWLADPYPSDLLCNCAEEDAAFCILAPNAEHAAGCGWKAETIVVPDIPQPERYYGNPQGAQYTATAEYTLPMTGDRAVILPEGGRAIITAPAGNGGQWQISDGVQWIDISGENSASLIVTEAKLNTIFELTGVAELRYFNKDSENVLASVSVTSDEIANGEYSVNPTERFALFAVQRAETDKHTIVINYLFSDDNEIVTSPYIATIEKGGNFNVVVPNPAVRGYELADTNVTNVPAGFTYTADAVTINVANIQADMTMNVYYVPTEVTYTVIHYAQNIDNDNYTEQARETMTGLTKMQVTEVALDKRNLTTLPNNTGFNPEGFFSLVYEKANIAADGSTIVEVYYDRNYYLLSFDLGGGYGVEPIYARFGAPVGTIADPVRAGYTFINWSLDGSTAVELPATVPAQSRKYKALWSAEAVSYTVVYWNADVKDDPGVTTYSYWGQKTVDSVAGTVLTPSEVGKAYPASSVDTIEDAGYFTYDEISTKYFNEGGGQVTVEGDGSTVVNVYYSRNVYEIRYIYARKNGTKYELAKSTGCGKYNNTSHEEYPVGHKYVETVWDAYSTTTLPVVKDAYKNNTGSFTEGGYTYYYIALKAEYGADIELSWPAAPLNNISGNYYDKWAYKNSSATFTFGSWAAQCESLYRKTYGNEYANVVGAYPYMSKEMIVDPANEVAQTMVAWWALTTENVEDHYYHIYLEALPGQKNAEGAVYKDGKYYVLAEKIHFTCAHNGSTRVDPFVYTGCVCVNDTRNTGFDTQANSNNYKYDQPYYQCPDGLCTYCNVFYYDRIDYTLSFFNYNKDTAAPASKTLMFGESFSSYQPGAPTYPSTLEKDAYTFAGWYTTAECHDGTEVNWAEDTMPAGNVTLYAKWEPVTHDVFFYLDKDAVLNNRELENGDLSKNVPHGTVLTEKQVPSGATNGGLTFIGWFYEENGTEKAFDFANMPITEDLHVYGKWSSNILKKYTVYFKLRGTDTEIADPITGSSLAGMTKTFDAKGGDELKPDYREGYFPEVKSHSLTLNVNDADNEGDNTYTFWYVKKDAVPYTVHYVAKELAAGSTVTDTIVLNGTTYYVLSPSVTDDKNTKAVVTETFKTIEGYMPDAYQKRIVVNDAAGAKNEIIFYYTVDIVNAYYKVSHWLEPVQGSDYVEYGSGTQAPAKIGTDLYAENFDLTLDGFTFKVEMTMSVVEGTAATVGSTPAKLTKDGLELRLYYVRNEYPYEIRYEELNTGAVLAPTEYGTKKFGATVTGEAKTIPGYTLQQVNPQGGQMSIRVEKNNAAELNIITYYYVENDVTFTYVGVAPDGATFDVCGTLSEDAETVKAMNGTALGSTAEAKLPAFNFVGWYDKDGKLLSTDAKYVPEKTTKILVYDAAASSYVEKDAYESGTFYARFAWNYAKLTITKKVDEQEGFTAPEDEKFAFTVTLTGVRPSDTFKVSITDEGELSMTLVNNALTFTLKDGQTAILYNLPVGTQYTVEETVPENFTVEYDGNAKGAIPENGVATTVINHYPLRYGELTVTKSGLKANESAIVDVVITTNNVPTTYTLVLNSGNPSATITNLQVGSAYTVAERTGWTWLYSSKPTYTNESGHIEDTLTTCTITNHSNPDKWMHDESYLVNDFGDGTKSGVNN